MQQFRAEIYKVGINPLVEVPDEVSRAFGIKGYVPVRGMLNNTPIIATLVPAGGGRHRLYINGDMRKQAGVDTGDEVSISLELDTEPRVLRVPEVLKEALEANKKARDAWEKMTPSRRNEILAYLNYLKTPEGLERNVKKVVEELLTV